MSDEERIFKAVVMAHYMARKSEDNQCDSWGPDAEPYSTPYDYEQGKLAADRAWIVVENERARLEKRESDRLSQ